MKGCSSRFQVSVDRLTITSSISTYSLLKGRRSLGLLIQALLNCSHRDRTWLSYTARPNSRIHYKSEGFHAGTFKPARSTYLVSVRSYAQFSYSGFATRIPSVENPPKLSTSPSSTPVTPSSTPATASPSPKPYLADLTQPFSLAAASTMRPRQQTSKLRTLASLAYKQLGN